MSSDSSPLLLLNDFAKVMRRWGDRWYVFGAQAVMLWGQPRMSADVDVTAQLSLDDATEFVADMQTGGFALQIDDFESFVQKTRVLPFLHSSTGLPLDVVVAGPGLEEEFLDRARRVRLGKIQVPVISPEDLIVSKILAGRPKDQEDVRGVVREQLKSLDLLRIRSLLSLLEEILTRSDLVPAFEQILSSVEER